MIWPSASKRHQEATRVTIRHAALLLTLPLLGIAAPQAAAQTLREAVAPGVLMGCAIASGDLADTAVVSLVTKQFNCITPEYELMLGVLADDAGHYNFAGADRVAAFAESHHMPVLGHMLLWHCISRKWLFEGSDGKPLPREAALANMKAHIAKLTGHYKGRVKGWDVVNEAISDKPEEYLKDTPALRAIGPDYIEKAFEFAHAADPQAQLYCNDYNIEQPAKLAKTIKLVRALQSKGLRIDAVGIQGHWLIDWPPPGVIASGIDAIADTGVKVMITELDVDVLPCTVSGADLQSVEVGPNPYPNGLPPDMQEKLAKRYGEIVAVLAHHPAVTMIGFWGTHDGRSWLNDYPVKHRTNYPLLFDRDCRPKPAYEAVIKALQAR
jgi:endo-1,4-beta-xylanase